MSRVWNQAEIFNARPVRILSSDSKTLVATHRNPKSGDIYVEDHGITKLDGWYSFKLVKFI